MNSEQRIAAQHLEGPLLVLAGPGTGKTTTLVGRYEFLLSQNINPKQIICCTFSKKAADELKERIASNSGLNATGLPIATFHALSLRILKSIGEAIGVPRDFDIWTKNFERERVVRELQKPVIQAGLYKDADDEEKTAKKALEYIDGVREELLDPEDASIRAAELHNKANIAHCEVYAAYESYLTKENKIDFPRMAQLACKALKKNIETGGNYAKGYKHVLVDEFQDINLAQKTLVDSFFGAGAQLWAVGDDYQAIYGWRGSNVRFMLDFAKEYPGSKIHALKQNYRSGKNILQLARNLSQHFLEAYKKELKPTRETDGKIYWDQVWDEDEEADAIVDEITLRIQDGIPLSEIAIISRTNNRPVKVASELIRRGLPIQIQGALAPFEEFEAKQLVAALAISSGVYLKLRWPRIPSPLYGFAKNIESDPWQNKVRALATYLMNRPPEGLNEDDSAQRKANLERYRDILLESSDAKQFFAVLEASLIPDGNKEKIFVGTIHRAKGLEWDSVFLMGLEDGHLPQRQSMAPKVYDEERRIAYVGITRAKNFLFLTTLTSKKEQKFEPSPFLKEMFGPDAASSTQSEKKTKTKDKPQSTTENPVFERIQNLQRKAADPACTAAESDAANAMIKKLMSKYNIGIKDGKLFVMPASNEDPGLYARRTRDQFYKKDVSEEENKAWVKDRWKAYQDKVVANNKEKNNLADGTGGDGTGWTDGSGGSGFLQEAGYTTRKDGPSTVKRQQILADVLRGYIHMPDWLSETVHIQWGAPNSMERLRKMRNTLNVALGTQKGRSNPSAQAIEKWETDIYFLDGRLKDDLVAEIGR